MHFISDIVFATISMLLFNQYVFKYDKLNLSMFAI